MYLRGRVSPGHARRGTARARPTREATSPGCAAKSYAPARRGPGRDRVPRDSQSCVGGSVARIFRARRIAAHSNIKPTHSSPDDAAPSTASRARAFTRVSSISSVGDRERGDAAAGADARTCGRQHDRADDHREVGAAVDAEVAERARVDAARSLLELVQDRHRTVLGRAGHRARPGTPPARRRARSRMARSGRARSRPAGARGRTPRRRAGSARSRCRARRCGPGRCA